MTRREKEGKFICIEGLDGSGKTTQAKKLVESLSDKGFDAVCTTEPSVGRVGGLIRSFVLDRDVRVSASLEALLFAADRVDHVESEVKPLLRRGKVVVCDRYVYSSLAYQGAAGLDLEWIERINRFALRPDLALFIDVAIDNVVKRLRGKRTVMENEQNLQRVREIYVRLVQKKNLKLVDGNGSVTDVAKDILRIVLESLGA